MGQSPLLVVVSPFISLVIWVFSLLLGSVFFSVKWAIVKFASGLDCHSHECFPTLNLHKILLGGGFKFSMSDRCPEESDDAGIVDRGQ